VEKEPEEKVENGSQLKVEVALEEEQAEKPLVEEAKDVDQKSDQVEEKVELKEEEKEKVTVS